mmetsp:Transcript_41369/g.70823  ORF Transcript_41369/g.70823 Transcript_41369/m.70823 type:complete len:736 (+) Transcript_41369:345-2552(+)
MENNIHKVEPASTHLFLTKRTVLGSPCETTNNRFLNFKKVVNSLRGVNEKVGTSSLRSEGPDLTCFRHIPSELISELTALRLGLSTSVDITIIDGSTELSAHSFSLKKETVVLVGRLGKTGLVRLPVTCLTERHNWIRHLDLCSHEVLLKILEANLQVQLTRSSNDVFTGFLGVTENHRIGFRQTLHTLNKLGQISGVLRLNGTTHNGGDRELHCLDGVGIISSDDGTTLKEVLINTNQSASVTSRDISDLLSVTTHHDDSTLDVLNPKLSLLSRDVVGSKDANLLASGNLSREDTTETVESSLIRSGDHLRDVHTERGTFRGVASADGSGGDIIKGSVVKGIDTVFLGLGRRRKVEHNHLQHSVSSRKPLLHNTLEELLANKLLLIRLKLNTNGLKHLLDLSMLLSHDSFEEGSDGGGNELTEGTFEVSGLVLAGPDLTRGVEVPVSPKLAHHLLLRHVELLAVSLGKALQCESPLVETRSEGNSSLGWVNLHITECLIVVHGNNHVNGLNGTAESLVELLSRELQLKKGTIDFVNHQTGPHTLGNSLTKHSLSLNAHSINGINNHKSTISHTKSGSNLTGEINVTRGVNQVDQIRVLRNLNIGVFLHLILHGLLMCLLFLLGQSSNLSGLDVIFEKHGNSRGLDGNTTLSLILTGIGVTSSASGLGGDDTSLLDEGVSKGGLSVIDVSDNGHGPDIVFQVHDGPHLIDCEVHHLDVLLLIAETMKGGIRVWCG